MSELALLITFPGSCGPLLPREYPLLYWSEEWQQIHSFRLSRPSVPQPRSHICNFIGEGMVFDSSVQQSTVFFQVENFLIVFANILQLDFKNSKTLLPTPEYTREGLGSAYIPWCTRTAFLARSDLLTHPSPRKDQVRKNWTPTEPCPPILSLPPLPHQPVWWNRGVDGVPPSGKLSGLTNRIFFRLDKISKRRISHFNKYWNMLKTWTLKFEQSKSSILIISRKFQRYNCSQLHSIWF